MAEKYNLPGPGTRPLFFRLPRGGGVSPGPATRSLNQHAARRGTSLMAKPRPGVRNWWTPAANNTNCN